MKSGNDYVEDIKMIRPRIYCGGEVVSDVVDHPLLRPIINTARATYELALDPFQCRRSISDKALANICSAKACHD
jgi:4-hydroxybutyryl-CoA dehydratase/vinylacetyl-CoA-Delta-isomerase